MQVAQAEILRSIDDNGIGIRDVDTTLDNGSCQEYIVVIIHEIVNNLFQFFRFHLSMTDAYTTIRDISLNKRLQFQQVLYAVVHEEYLSVSAHLKVDSLGNDFFVERMYFCLNRITIGWRCLDDRQVSRSHKRELQGTRYRSSRHSERIDVHFQLAKFFLYPHTELLLFVDDKQTKILELHALADEFVCTYQDLDFTIRQFLQDTGSILRRTGTTEVFHLTREFLQTFTECLIMLVSQHRSRHKYGYLLIVRCRLKSRTNGYFRLTEAHIATNESVHRAVAFHICLHIVGSLQLIRSIFINETSLQLMLQETIRIISISLFLLSLRIKSDKVTGNVLDFRLGLFLDFLPSTRT